MDDTIETTLISIIKEEDVKIKDEVTEDSSHLNREIEGESQGVCGELNTEIKEEPPEDINENNTVIKEEPPEDINENNTEGNVDDLGQFYQVMCEGVPDESAVEEDIQSNGGHRCAHSKEIEKLETRVGRLENLLDVLVSKVMLSPIAKPVKPSSSSPYVTKLIARNNGRHLISSLPIEAVCSTLPTNKEQSCVQQPVLQTIRAQSIPTKVEFNTTYKKIFLRNVMPNSNNVQTSNIQKKREPLEIPKTFDLLVPSPAPKQPSLKKIQPVVENCESTVQQISDTKKFVPDVPAMPKCAKSKILSPRKPGFVFDESMPVDVDESKSELVAAAKAGSLPRVNLAMQCLRKDVERQVGIALMVASTPEVVETMCRLCPKVVHEVEASRALFFAAESGHVGIMKQLLIAGVNPNACNRNSLTVLHKAASKGHEECVKALLEKGARVSATTNCRWTALHMAAISGAANCITALLKYGANVDEPDNMGCTALHYAARWDHQEVIQVLLDKGANPKFKNLRGKSPISFSHSETVTLMLTKGNGTGKRTKESQPGLSKKLKYDVQLAKLSSDDKLSSFHSFESTVSTIPDCKQKES